LLVYWLKSSASFIQDYLLYSRSEGKGTKFLRHLESTWMMAVHAPRRAGTRLNVQRQGYVSHSSPNMIFLPIFGREFRLATQRRRTYWVRSYAAAVAVGIGGWMLTTIQSWQAGASVGRSLFDTLSTLASFRPLSLGRNFHNIGLSHGRETIQNQNPIKMGLKHKFEAQ